MAARDWTHNCFYLFIYFLLFVAIYCCLATWGVVGTEIKCQQRVNSEEDNSPAVAARDWTHNCFYLFIFYFFVAIYCCLATWGVVGTEIKCQQRVNSEEDSSAVAARDWTHNCFIFLFVTFCSSLLLFSYVTEAACFWQQMSHNLSCTVTKATCFWQQLSQNLSCTLSQKLCVFL